MSHTSIQDSFKQRGAALKGSATLTGQNLRDSLPAYPLCSSKGSYLELHEVI